MVALPSDVHVSHAMDQSPMVARAITSLMVEGALGALLAGAMVLLFLRDRRAALIVGIRAVLQATPEGVVPLLIAMLCVVAVFLPSFAMQGAARALFVPLSLAVGFSMIASCLRNATGNEPLAGVVGMAADLDEIALIEKSKLQHLSGP